MCLLLLPPPNRRKLHLLLRFMNKVCNNRELQLDRAHANRDLVLATFWRCVLRPPIVDTPSSISDVICLQIVTFLVDNYAELMRVPLELKSTASQRIATLQKAKVFTSVHNQSHNIQVLFCFWPRVMCSHAFKRMGLRFVSPMSYVSAFMRTVVGPFKSQALVYGGRSGTNRPSIVCMCLLFHANRVVSSVEFC